VDSRGCSEVAASLVRTIEVATKLTSQGDYGDWIQSACEEVSGFESTSYDVETEPSTVG
jgi:hypothetical protein